MATKILKNYSVNNFMICDIEGHSKNYPYSQMPTTGANSTPTSNPIMYNSTIKENNSNEYVKAAVFINKFYVRKAEIRVQKHRFGRSSPKCS